MMTKTTTTYDLQFDVLAVQFHVVDLEVDADGADEVWLEVAIDEPRKQCA
jgi:hypothetical protein